MQLSNNFTRDENRCKCMECNQYGADVELVGVLEYTREWVRREHKRDGVVIVNSWFRCRAHNNRPNNERNSYGVLGAGSNDNSWHLTGGAADIWVPGVDILSIHAHLEDQFPDNYGIGLYEGFVHIDVRPTKARWCA